MNTLTLVIGNKNYSSWSLRPWLFMKHHGLAFDEIRVSLYAEGSPAAIKKYSPSGLVPVLIDGDLKVWDTLAICEYVSETFLDGKGWPEARQARAVARSVSAEMHSGFQKLRMSLPMNLKGRFAWRDLISKILQYDFPLMVRQAHHERKIMRLRSLCPFVLSLSKGEWAKTEESC